MTCQDLLMADRPEPSEGLHHDRAAGPRPQDRDVESEASDAVDPSAAGRGARPGPGLRERKKLERRRTIEDAALELFESVGFDGATISEIAERSGISARTFFYYFETKEDVVLADYERRLGRLIEEFRSRPEDEHPWSSLRAAFMAVAADYQVEEDRIRRRFVLMADNPSVFARSLQLQAGWEDAMSEALTIRRHAVMDPPAADSIVPRLLAASAVAAMRSSLRHWFSTGRTRSLPTIVGECFDTLGTGLALLD